ncbi:hypothetical protein JF634_11290 [Simonsiella muelleri]|uniref:Uncharacterized protein n=1 Tax=Simonsiella muelleri ATCC 29453 TaxID=641147 RepID=V9H795_9NEIS|nr:hypothetical protein [Simonsiella muelleri]AUX61650.1 hypothetical protein BWP33_07460 [Simonsiella muelleri ATCC 29453]EFG29804.1 hypothetical protein HMPREF9021_02361 [Simonsiella muelleri ATCC 29453]UBQ53720.1 hypothetical protein JF634_11290 [Simonsiella muelleri]
MSDKKNIWQNPALAAAGIATFMSAVANYLNLDANTMKLISTISPPISILLSYICIWALARFFAFSIAETKVLTRLNKREKIILKELKKTIIYGNYWFNFAFVLS